jgi:hypothetical protein
MMASSVQRQLSGVADAGFFQRFEFRCVAFASAALMLMRAAKISMSKSVLPLCMTPAASSTLPLPYVVSSVFSFSSRRSRSLSSSE